MKISDDDSRLWVFSYWESILKIVEIEPTDDVHHLLETDSEINVTPPKHHHQVPVVLFFICAGFVVSCLYYIQPILPILSKYFHQSESTISLLVSLGQVGFVCGIAFIVPLGDIVRRHNLVPLMLSIGALSMILSALSVNFPMLLIICVIAGLAASTGQILVPWAASLAAPDRQGKVVGQVMSGILTGILLSRIISGFIAHWWGWRIVMWFGAVPLILCAIAIKIRVKPQEPMSSAKYHELLKSVITLVREEPVLRLRMLLGSLTMFSFSVIWTPLAFLLSGSKGEPYHFNSLEIGLFALAGLMGVLVAPIVGKLSDKGKNVLATNLSWCNMIIGWLCLLAAGFNLHGWNYFFLIAGLVICDSGVQGSQLSNQSTIYPLRPEARSRITTAYMICYFLGAVLGSIAAGYAYAIHGWSGVCVTGLTFSILGLFIWLISLRKSTAHI